MPRLAEVLARHAEAAGERIAMSDGFQSLTWSELAAWTGGIAEDLGV